ncbi:hypothetical protein BGZ99_000876 [Dissophora globulifera]|uniref:Life-span regulatory factor n=1 Tax=Dissophora globulifera TaxID=979702 RepID=A0A9P6V0N2_9FUNG|nr:hypothetical protein BGZ99_000876 [Dissophora globulifera]
MDLNWCPVCEQHIPVAWESSLYCSDRCKRADELTSQSGLGYTYPPEMQSFPRNSQGKTLSSPCYSPLSSPSLMGLGSATSSTGASALPAITAYPSPPTSPMSHYVYDKTSGQGRLSPSSFSLGQPAAYDLQLRRKSTTTIAAPQYVMNVPTHTNTNKKTFFS